MLAPILSPAKTRRFVAYDLEWYPNSLELRLAGSWDGEKYRPYYTMKDFLEGELVPRNKGKILFAHAGGNFDVQFVLEEVIRVGGFEVVATFSGSSAVIVKIRKGRNVWVFGDSYFLLREPLRKIGKWIGFEKEDLGFEGFDAPLSILRDYNMRDCQVLYRGIEYLQNHLLDLGGEMTATLASCAMKLFRRRHLKETIHTSGQLNEECMGAYYASRVEVLQTHCLEANYYDINSSFPASMCKPQPGELINYNKKLSDKLDALFIADVTVSVPHVFLPPLPYRDRASRVLFPTGTWRAQFDVTDIRLLLETGGRIEQVHSVAHFAPFNDLADYVGQLYELKRTAKGFAREVYKLLLNALYGKFGERPEKEKILINPKSTRCPAHDPDLGCTCLRLIVPGVWQKNEIVDVQHAHVPISSHITALSRKLLFDYLNQCKDPYYCDTDSVICGPRDHFPTSDVLGELKLEFIIKRAHFLAPKLYHAMQEPDEHYSPTGPLTQARAALAEQGWEEHPSGLMSKARTKGFRKMNYQQWDALVSGREHAFTRMLSIKEAMRMNVRESRSGNPFKVRQEPFHKKIRLKNPKRFLFADGTTRPWTINEIVARGDATKVPTKLPEPA